MIYIANNIKKVFLVLLIGLAIAGTVSAQGMMGGYGATAQNNTQASTAASQNQDMQAALQSIYASQQISSQGQIDCGKVTDAQFTAVGDAYMGSYLSAAQHQAMDQMMDGEGSATLEQAHINMGRSYLGCWSGYNSGPVHMPMMGYNYGGYEQNNQYAPGYGMMGEPYDAWASELRWNLVGWITILLVWGLLILGIVALVRVLRKK